MKRKELITISVDLKKARIRFYKSMLHSLNNPKHIQLLVNPNNRHIAIRAVDVAVSGDQTERITPQVMKADNSVEMYSKAFISKLCSVTGGLEPNCTYRLSGTIVSSHKIAVFSLDTLTRVKG